MTSDEETSPRDEGQRRGGSWGGGGVWGGRRWRKGRKMLNGIKSEKDHVSYHLIRDNGATLKRIAVKLLSGKGGKHTHTACVSSPN